MHFLSRVEWKLMKKVEIEVLEVGNCFVGHLKISWRLGGRKRLEFATHFKVFCEENSARHVKMRGSNDLKFRATIDNQILYFPCQKNNFPLSSYEPRHETKPKKLIFNQQNPPPIHTTSNNKSSIPHKSQHKTQCFTRLNI